MWHHCAILKLDQEGSSQEGGTEGCSEEGPHNPQATHQQIHFKTMRQQVSYTSDFGIGVFSCSDTRASFLCGLCKQEADDLRKLLNHGGRKDLQYTDLPMVSYGTFLWCGA